MKTKPMSGNTLEATMRLIEEAMKYVDGSATVSFQVSHDGQVSAFKLVNNDSTEGRSA